VGAGRKRFEVDAAHKAPTHSGQGSKRAEGTAFRGVAVFTYNRSTLWAHRRTGRLIEADFMILDITGIQKILPHRYPFLMIDAVLEMERLKRVVGIKNVTINENFFAGHFPGKPVMPGVLIIESMAQAGGVLLLQEVPERDSKLLYFVAIDDARFRRPVVPGDQLRVEVDVLSWRGTFCKLAGKASVDGQLAAEATLMCKMVDRDP
jgi:3-hydroxyacyl-[acyl-carrier-protein] dehydratase